MNNRRSTNQVSDALAELVQGCAMGDITTDNIGSEVADFFLDADIVPEAVPEGTKRLILQFNDGTEFEVRITQLR